MKITLKTLKQQTFFVEVDVQKDTVQTLKEKLCAESGQAYPVDRQRLIYLGKIMEDDHPLSQYNLDDKKFIVVMNKKPTPAEEPAAASAAGSSATEPTPASEVKPPAEAASPKVARPETARPAPKAADDNVFAAPNAPSAHHDQPVTAGQESGSAAINPSTDAVSPDVQINIQRLVEMGYPEHSARIALEICANIPDRAVEYLLSEMGGGTDASLAMAAVQEQLAHQQQQRQQQQQQQAVPVGGGGGGSAGEANPLAFLRDNPVFQDMKRILRDDPSMLPHLMRRMQDSNPDLLDIIATHQEDFLALINEGTPAPAGRELSRELEDIAAAMVNSLTPSDMDAIERLKALGYPEHLVIQAYIACERDEYNAAEFLVSQTLDDDD
uniref:UV excision repair protein RAD23 n=1 Tax=Anopheles farauti TaxID=69004 RepID=A0A182Q8E7_9DIPT